MDKNNEVITAAELGLNIEMLSQNVEAMRLASESNSRTSLRLHISNCLKYDLQPVLKRHIETKYGEGTANAVGSDTAEIVWKDIEDYIEYLRPQGKLREKATDFTFRVLNETFSDLLGKLSLDLKLRLLLLQFIKYSSKDLVYEDELLARTSVV